MRLEANARLIWIRLQHAGTDQGLSTRHVKVKALAGFNGQTFASLADFGVVRAE
jgi:hypothetical protein